MKKILIALDFDPAAEKIAETGYKLAKSMSAEVILLHVTAEAFYYSSQNYSPIMGFDGFSNLSVAQPLNFEALNQAARDYLEKSKQHLGDDTIQTVVKEGEFSESILETAKEMNVDIIVMGSHGRHGLDKVLLGSVAEQVLQKTDIPLFIIPTKKFEDK